MRVLFYYSSRHWSGSARSFAAAAAGLAPRGYQVTYVCHEESHVERRLSYGGYEVVALPMGGTWVADALRLRQVLSENFVEVAFVHTEREHLVASLATRLAERGAVVRRIPAGGRFTQGIPGRLGVRLAATGFLFTTQPDLPVVPPMVGVLEPMSADLGVEVDAMDLVRPVAKSSVGAAGTTRLIVCIYDPSARRRAATVLRAIALLAPRHPELRLALLGVGSDHEDLRMHAAALGITEIVAHLGERDDHLSVVRAADLAWVIADQDNAAFGFLDAMALRVPVLAERGPLARRYIADGITGVLIGAADPPTTAARIANLLAHDDRRVAMGNAGRTRVAREFTDAAMVDGFEHATKVARDRSRWHS